MDADPVSTWESAQYDDELETLVKAGFYHNQDGFVQEIIVIDHRSRFGEHQHTVLDEFEQEVFSSEGVGDVIPISVKFGPFHKKADLIAAWRQSLRSLDNTNDQQIAWQMASQVISADHDEWWLGAEAEDAVIAEVTNLVFHLETPDGDPSWRVEQWERIRALLDSNQGQ